MDTIGPPLKMKEKGYNRTTKERKKRDTIEPLQKKRKNTIGPLKKIQ